VALFTSEELMTMNFHEKILQIEKLLPNDKRIKNKAILACGIYLKIKMNLPFRALPTEIYSWSSYRHWMQRLKKLNLLNQIERIVGGGDTHESNSA